MTDQRYRITQYQFFEPSLHTTVCQGIIAGSTNGRSFEHVYDPPHTPGQGLVGLRTRRAAASFDFVVVYSLGGPLACNPPELCL
jgi:hypothetical protein